MITFLDENDVEYGALATIKATNAVNGERSLTGTIVSGDYVLSNIDRGWRLRFDDEYYVVTYAKPIDEGRDVQVTFDAVHQFFWDFDKSSVYDQLTDGSHTFVAYLDFIFKNSGYSYTVDSALNVYAFEKQSFGLKKRLTLFNDVITSTGVEFQVNGKVVRILEKVGTDLSTVVRKNFNMNELTIEQNIGDFVTYQKGYGAYFDEEDHSKGRLEVEYTSALASVYGKLEAEPLVDERYTQSSSLLAALKANVDNSYTISVSLDMEDLTRAGYKYTQPIAGDYIMAINETLDFQEKIRIVSFTSEYDVRGILVKHEVTCNDIGTAKKLTASYNTTKRQASTASINATKAYSIANRALVSADGKNTNYYGNSFPQDTPKGTLKTGDLLFLTVGDTVKQYYWNGSDWIINPVVSDVEAFKEQIAEELKEVPDREEFEATIAQELATSKAEIETQIDTAKTQAESNAKAYADEINQATAEVAEKASTATNSLKSDLAKVKTDLTTVSNTANSAKTSASEAKQQLATVANDLSKAKTDLQNAVSAVDTKATNLQSDVSNLNTSLSNTAKALQTQGTTLANQAKELQTQASQLTEQAKAQETLTTRVEKVETTANGTKTTVSELSKTVAQNGKDITSVSNRTKTVETGLTSAKTSISELQTSVSTAQTDLTNLTKRTKTVEDDLSGTKTNLSELTQTVSSDGKTIASLTSRTKTVEDSVSGLKTTMSSVQKDLTAVTTRTKTVEDDLAGTKTTLSQVKTTADNTSKKTATLETGLNGLTAKFESLSVGTTNHFLDSSFETTIQKIGITQNGNVYTPSIDTTEKYYGYNTLKIVCKDSTGVDNPKITYPALAKLKTAQQGKLPDVITISFWGKTDTEGMSLYTRLGFTGYEDSQNVTLATDWKRYIVHVKTSSAATNEWLFKFSKAGTVWIAKPQFEFSAIASDYHLAEEDASSKVAEYKQTADQNYASLQTTVKALDGTVTANKATADQTAQGFSTRIESLETYKDGESTRANQYFESAKTETARQLTAERTAIAKDYVAKSTYTSDVTGIRNDLTATTTTANTTKTNLANYQASNDKAVANLQSNLQTANGNISSLKTKVEAVPGQITSAVSAVEGKIPTEIGGRNLYALSKNAGIYTYGVSEFTQNVQTGEISWKTASVSDSQFGNFTSKIGTIYGRVYGIKIPVVQGKDILVSLTDDRLIKNYAMFWGEDDTLVKNTIKYTTNRFKIPASQLEGVSYLTFRIGVKENTQEIGTLIKTKVKVEYGNVYTDWSPAPEDTASQISNLSSQIQQTADGMTLLATKTELNSAKSDLQSGITTATSKANSAQATANSNAQTISTHTTQISALNTGLQAKVSQSDFDSLSGRVTTAENNITAKANELSSKISSVEGLIPTSIDTVNLIKGTGSAFVMGYGITNSTWNETKKQSILDFSVSGVNRAIHSEILPQNGKFFDFKPIKGMTYTQSIMIDTDATFNPNGQAQCSWFTYSGHNQQKAYIKKVGEHTYQVWSTYTWNLENTALRAFDWYDLHNILLFRTTGTYLAFYKPKLTTGNLPSDWSPSPEDYDSKLATARSEIKQTTDAISASVSALDKSTVKSASLTINSDGIVIEAGKSPSDIAYGIGSYFSVNQNAINLFSDKINVKANMIVDGAITSTKIASKSINTAHLNGKIITADVISSNAVTADAIKAGAITTDKMTANSINGDRITAGTLDAAKIKAGSITASQIASGTITSSQIKAGGISAANIATGAITTAKIAANSINSDKIVSNGLSANVIKGGVLTATNNAMQISLTTGQLEFYTSAAAMRRVLTNYPNQFIKFDTGKYDSIDCGVTVIGSNRNGTSEDDNNGAFAGVRIWNGYNSSKTMDHIDLVGDTIRLVHSAYDSPKGWEFYNWNNNGSPLLKLYGANADQRAGSYIEAGDIHIMKSDGTYMSLKSILNTFNGNFSSNGGRYYINGI